MHEPSRETMHAVAEKTMHNRMDSILGGCCINGFYGYGGQVGVGRAVKASGVPCEEIHINVNGGALKFG